MVAILTIRLLRNAALLRFGLFALLLCWGFTAHAAQTQDMPTGRWLTSAHDAVIQISPCGRNLCGQIVGIATAHPNDPMPKDWQGAPTCGVTILETAPQATPAGTTEWVGSVLDPRSGAVYHAKIVLDEFKHLILHGYVGMPLFGRSQTWTAYTGPAPQNCRLATLPGNVGGNG
jgi:uncharacterized protein (DUF2147 family)